MRIFDKEQKLIKIICNQCGTSEDVDGGLMKKEFVSVEKEWGYFSDKDTQIHRFDLCEACYDRLVAGFCYPVELERRLEL
ncbi:ribosomal-protein-alanine N-acetyltransferase [Catenibacillus scindens]|uniref:Ribosomal-protein-alanine N-acetyltransferase n=1 Tax=Catenibacillus scindens TaxID=673271 RepID=A0A7W8HC68_9FIRM|nr:hypothetical protein [Catenibacillus scindens]MBB5265605.1 ribosomal-protein-alanine N-acetyltransferase [Catenibacillus scindens]